MDRQDREIATEAVMGLCDAANRWAAEIGLYAGQVTAVIEKGQVEWANIHSLDVRCPHPAELRRSSSCGCPSLAEIQSRFEKTSQRKLADTVVCFGRVLFVFSEGRLRRIEVTEKFRIEREIPELARIFLPGWGQTPTTRDAFQGFA